MRRARYLIPFLLWRLVLTFAAASLPLIVAGGAWISWSWALATAGVVTLAGTVAALVLTRDLQRFVVVPIENLETVASDWRREKLNARATSQAPDELGSLTDKLNSMAGHLEKVFAKLTVRTRTDLVTGLPSRSQLLLDITLAQQPVLFLVNVDSFKEINDSFGNRSGDLLLQALAQRLEEFQASLPYKLYKMPADEFALVFDVSMDDTDVTNLARSLTEKINGKSFVLGEQSLNLHVTCGVARAMAEQGSVPERGAWSHLLAQADMALKKAKKTFRPYLLFQESLDIQQEFERSLYWKSAVGQALRENRIRAHYQPIIDNLTGATVKYETLARLMGTDGVAYMPGEFLEAARRAHLDGEITKAMLAQSFEEFSERPFDFSINLTVRDMLSPEILRFLRTQVEARPETARRLVLEILESEGIENYVEVKSFLTSVKEFGIKVAIDDFGTGYSNFGHLLKLEVDYIKLDASLIRNLDTDLNAQIIVKTIVGFSKELGLKTISEHVHTREVQEMAQRLGVDFSQGFYLGRPGLLESR